MHELLSFSHDPFVSLTNSPARLCKPCGLFLCPSNALEADDCRPYATECCGITRYAKHAGSALQSRLTTLSRYTKAVTTTRTATTTGKRYAVHAMRRRPDAI